MVTSTRPRNAVQREADLLWVGADPTGPDDRPLQMTILKARPGSGTLDQLEAQVASFRDFAIEHDAFVFTARQEPK